MTPRLSVGPERLIPPHAPGMRIGLFGGTFDPPHQAHLGASLLALRRLKLDRVWWLVTPGNPLKNTSGLAPLCERIASARALARHPRIDVTGLEAVIKTRYTYDTLTWLISRCPGVRFVWLMGADNLRSFHRWQNWRGIATFRLRSSTVWVRASTRRRARPGSRCPMRGSGNTTPQPCPNAGRRPGPFCMGSNPPYPQPPCGPCVGSEEPCGWPTICFWSRK